MKCLIKTKYKWISFINRWFFPLKKTGQLLKLNHTYEYQIRQSFIQTNKNSKTLKFLKIDILIRPWSDLLPVSSLDNKIYLPRLSV